MTTINNNKYWICPYNPAHVLPNNQRTQRHLSKCKKTYAGKEKQVCPFNALHVVSTQEFQDHIMECRDKVIVDRDIVYVQNSANNPEPHQGLKILPSELERVNQEDMGEAAWDSILPGTAGYDPSDAVKNRAIMRGPKPAVGKATQKKFREKDIRRLEQISKGEAPDTDSEEEEEKVVPKRPSFPRPLPKSFPDENGLFNPVYNSKGSGIVGEIEPGPPPRPCQGIAMGRGANQRDESTPGSSVSTQMQSRGRAVLMTSPENRRADSFEPPRMPGAGRGILFPRPNASNQVNRQNERPNPPRPTKMFQDYPGFSEAAGRSNDLGSARRPSNMGREHQSKDNTNHTGGAHQTRTAAKEGQFEDAPEVPMNDLSGRSRMSVYQMNLQKLKKISALNKKRGPLTPEEQELVDSEEQIYEAMEKLNL